MEIPVDLEEKVKQLSTMDNPARLYENLASLLLILAGETKKVEDIRDDVVRKGDPRRMKQWLENIEDLQTKVAQIQTKFQEFESYRRYGKLIAKPKLNKEVIECLELVHHLIETGETIAESIEKFLGELSRDTLKRFSHEELRIFTKDFIEEIGQGGFGHVYKGCLPHGEQVAVKVLVEKDVVEEMFMAEVRTICKTYHRNLIKLYGYCFDPDMKALVYDYMEKGSFDKILYENNTDIEWEKLHEIAIETAKGIAYLHDGCREQIIHYDLKAANVLLDFNFAPKVTDFGLAKLTSRDASHCTSTGMRGTLNYAAPDASHYTSTGMRGTPGYAAPETYMLTSKTTYKCDVYSFGIMLFEILGRKKNSHGEGWFPKQVWNKFEEEKLDEIIMECGISEKDKDKAKILAMVALWCTQFTPETRPSMSTVVKMLENEIVVKNPPDPMYC